MTIVALAILFIITQVQCADPLYALRAIEGRVVGIVSTDPSRGYMTDLINLEQYAEQFPNLLNQTAYDANTDTFIFGNIDPPTLCFANTLSQDVQIVDLPQYGSLTSIATYDGLVYTIFGLDEDAPTVGRMATVDLQTNAIKTTAKWKMPQGSSLYVGAPFLFLPSYQTYLLQVKTVPENRTKVVLIQTDGPNIVMKDSEVPSGWNSFWMSLARDNLTVVGEKSSGVYMIDPISGKTNQLKHFNCSGQFAVDFKGKQIFDLSKCAYLQILTATFTNKTVKEVEADPELDAVVGLHTSNPYSPFGCGSPCGIQPDCAKFKTCKTCRAGRCSDQGECASWCANNADCYAGICANNCDNGRCGRKGCGQSCLNHEDCKKQGRTCTICRLGVCSDAGECGNYCLKPTDCYGGGPCEGRCNNWQCSPDK